MRYLLHNNTHLIHRHLPLWYLRLSTILHGLFCALYLCVLPVYAQEQDSPQEEFKLARNAYIYGNYTESIRRFRQLLYPDPGKLRDLALRKEAHKYMGISYYYLYQNQKDKRYINAARRELFSYLIQDPEARLDPLLYPPDLVDFFNQIRRENERHLQAISRRKSKIKVTPIQVIPLHLERQIYNYHPIITILPFGIPQYINGHTLKASLILAAEAISLTMNITAYYIVSSKQIREGGQQGRFRTEDIPAVQSWQIVQFTAFGIFAALIVYGFIDGLMYFQRQRTSLLPSDLPNPEITPSARMKELPSSDFLIIP